MQVRFPAESPVAMKRKQIDEIEAAKAKFKTFKEIPPREGGHRLFQFNDNPLFYFDFPPEYPFKPPRIWTNKYEVVIDADKWYPGITIMAVIAKASRTFYGEDIPGRRRVLKTECKVCNKKSTTECAGCHHVLYCGETCQRADWTSGHQDICKK